MKKSIMLIASVLLLSSSAIAQTSDLEALYKSGKAAFDSYDKSLISLQMNQKIDTTAFVNSLKKGFADFQAALPLDSVKQVNKDGTPKIDKKTGLQQVKTKYSKEMNSVLAGHISDLERVANFYLNAQKLKEAAKWYEDYFTMLKSPLAIENKVAQPADTILGKDYTLCGYCYYNTGDKKSAFTYFDKALACGLTKPYGIELSAYKADCFALFLQEKIDKKDYDGAYALIEKEIASDPNNATYPYFKGVVMANDSTKSFDEQLSWFKKSLELDPKFGNAYYYAGDVVRQEYLKFLNDNPTATMVDLAPKAVPMLNESLGYYEKSKENGSSFNADRYIDGIKYYLDQYAAAVSAKSAAPKATTTTPAPATTTTTTKKSAKSKKK